MSVKCEEPIDELAVQVWLLYHHPNFKYCSLFVSGTELQTDRRTIRLQDAPANLSGRGHKKFLIRCGTNMTYWSKINGSSLNIYYYNASDDWIVMPLWKRRGILLCTCRSVCRYVGRSVGRSVCRSVGMSVSLNLVQLITQERFASEASNLVGR